MEKLYEHIAAFIDSRREEMLLKLMELVNIEGHFKEKENVEAARAWFQKELEAEGLIAVSGRWRRTGRYSVWHLRGRQAGKTGYVLRAY